MYWNEDERDKPFQVPGEIVDVAFRIACRSLPLDHAHALSGALHAALPWLAEEPRAGVHLIHGAESGNGWYRPEDPEHETLQLSRRTRLTLRLPRERVTDVEALCGRTLDVAGHPLTVHEPAVRPLSSLPTLFARYVIAREGEGEEAFVTRAVDELKASGIQVRKVLCGRVHHIRTPEGTLFTRSLMVADLEPAHSVLLQQQGLGAGRKLGCGLFIAHKGVAPVKGMERG